MRRDADWRRDPRLWEVHVDGYGHRRAIEASARKHGALGESFRALLAARLVLVDVGRDGSRPTPAQAWRSVQRWAAEGPRMRRAA